MGKTPGHSNTNTRLQALPDRQFFWGLFFIWISISGFVSSQAPTPPPDQEKDIQITHRVHDGHAILSCIVKDLGRRRIIWSRLSDPYPISVGSLRFHPDRKYRVSNEVNTNTLTIKNVGLQDAGEYQCLVSGSYLLKEVISLNIQSGPRITYFLPTNRSMVSSVNLTVTLPCEVDNLNDKMVMWKDGRNNVVSLRKRIYNGDRRMKVIHDTRPEWHLKIENLQENDFGFYTCVVNSDPVLTRTVELINKEPPKVAPVLKKDTNFRRKIEVMEGETVTMICNFHGYPIPTVKWYKRVVANNRTRKEPLHATGNRYILRSVRPEYSGDYICIANNGMKQEAKARTKLIVKAPPTTVLTTVATTTFIPTGPVSPHLYYEVKKVGTGRGVDAQLKCFAIGQPRPKVHWKRRGESIIDDHKYEVRGRPSGRHRTLSTLIIRGVGKNDFGMYDCVAYNTLGLTQVHLQLYDSIKYPNGI